MERRCQHTVQAFSLIAPQSAGLVHPMRLRLFHLLSLGLIACIVVTVLVMAGWMTWQLRTGFSTYLDDHDRDKLEQLAGYLARRAEQAGGLEPLVERISFASILRTYAAMAPGAEPAPPETGPMHRAPAPAAVDPIGNAQTADAQTTNATNTTPSATDLPPGDPSRRPRLDAFSRRVLLASVDGRKLAGPPGAEPPTHRPLTHPPPTHHRPIHHHPKAPPPPDHPPPPDPASAQPPITTVPIVLHGQTLGWLHLLPAQRLHDPVADKFLRDQYLGIAAMAAVLAALSIPLAIWLMRHVARPLRDIQRATQAIAQGRLDTRLADDQHTELGDLMRNLNQMAQALQRHDTLRKRWTADVSHELRTPLAVLQGEIEALLDGVRPVTPQTLQSLQQEVLHLGRLVNDLHALSLAQLDALRCDPAPIDVAALLHSTAQRFALRAQQAGLTIQVLLPESGPDSKPEWAPDSVSASVPASRPTSTHAAHPQAALPTLHADPQRISQVLDNLLENSLRYTDAPGQVLLQACVSDPHLLILLDDSAPGVPADTLPQLFEPLFRADTHRSRRAGGSGLGLAICAAWIDAHHGTIAASASPLGGLRVEIRLPLDAKPLNA